MGSEEYLYPPVTHKLKTESSKSFALGGKIMLGAIVVLICVVVLMIALHLYARWYLLRARRRQLIRRRNRLNEARRASQFVFYIDNDTTTTIDPGNIGLDSTVLKSLPVFVYSTKTQPEAVDCAVCLSEFEDGEKGRLLPKCNHAFHIECIDMWFNSHSTCPLCRSPVEPVINPDISGSGLMIRTGVEQAGSSSGLCVECRHHEDEGNSSTTSLGSRRKGFDVRIEVPNRTELDDELTLSSPASGPYKSPGARLFSQSMKRILSIGGRKTPTGESSSSPYAAAATSCSTTELDLEQGPIELPLSRNRDRRN